MVNFFHHHKLFSLCLLLFLGLILLLPFASWRYIYNEADMVYGTTFSAPLIRAQGLDWQKAYTAILDELQVKHLRLMAYWNEIETTPGIYNFSDLDWQLEQAAARQTDVILAIGARLPRWPECHIPDWVKDKQPDERREALLKYVRHSIERYRANPIITAWQIENEPFLPHFGVCPRLSTALLEEEIALVRSLDQRPIVITDSGEISIWVPAMRRADIFGTSIYLRTYSRWINSYVHYPIIPAMVRLKYNIALALAFPKPKEAIVIEMQAEPWGEQPYWNLTPLERSRTMNLERLRYTLDFARHSGFRTVYLWGAEWWWWEKVVNGDESYWELIKNVVRGTSN